MSIMIKNYSWLISRHCILKLYNVPMSDVCTSVVSMSIVIVEGLMYYIC